MTERILLYWKHSKSKSDSTELLLVMQLTGMLTNQSIAFLASQCISVVYLYLMNSSELSIFLSRCLLISLILLSLIHHTHVGMCVFVCVYDIITLIC